jgi:hypothetical protein
MYETALQSKEEKNQSTPSLVVHMRLSFIPFLLFWTIIALADEVTVGLAPGARFPAITLNDTQGRAVTLTDSLEQRPLLITIGATW